jgi:hypothetical protein
MVEKVEKVLHTFSTKAEWLYEYTKSHNRVPTITVDAGDTGTAIQRTEH